MFHIALVRIDQRDLGGPNCLTRAGTPRACYNGQSCPRRSHDEDRVGRLIRFPSLLLWLIMSLSESMARPRYVLLDFAFCTVISIHLISRRILMTLTLLQASVEYTRQSLELIASAVGILQRCIGLLTIYNIPPHSRFQLRKVLQLDHLFLLEEEGGQAEDDHP
ncbi:unnamed protein product [Camellia sinensis]